MTNVMFNYMTRVMSACDSTMHFPIQAVSAESDIPLLMDAKSRGWIHIESHDCHITPAGVQAFRSEKELREHEADQEADKRRTPARKKPLIILTKSAKWVAGAIGVAVIAEIVSLFFH